MPDCLEYGVNPAGLDEGFGRQRMEPLSLLLKCYNARKEAIPSRRDQAIYRRGLESVYDGQTEN